MEFERSRKRVAEINLTALIDIVFHLMVFVMLTTSFVVAESMELSLPGARAKPAADSKALQIQINSDGTAMLGDRVLRLNELNVPLGRSLGTAPETPVAIFTTPGVSVQQLVAVMDVVYLVGGRNVQVNKVEQHVSGAE